MEEGKKNKIKRNENENIEKRMKKIERKKKEK